MRKTERSLFFLPSENESWHRHSHQLWAPDGCLTERQQVPPGEPFINTQSAFADTSIHGCSLAPRQRHLMKHSGERGAILENRKSGTFFCSRQMCLTSARDCFVFVVSLLLLAVKPFRPPSPSPAGSCWCVLQWDRRWSWSWCPCTCRSGWSCHCDSFWRSQRPPARSWTWAAHSSRLISETIDGNTCETAIRGIRTRGCVSRLWTEIYWIVIFSRSCYLFMSNVTTKAVWIDFCSRSPLNLLPLTWVCDGCDVLHDVFTGFCLSCPTFTWHTSAGSLKAR